MKEEYELKKTEKRLKILFAFPRFLKWIAFFLFIYAIFDVLKGRFLVAGIEMIIVLFLYFGFPYLLIQFFFKIILKENKKEKIKNLINYTKGNNIIAILGLILITTLSIIYLSKYPIKIETTKNIEPIQGIEDNKLSEEEIFSRNQQCLKHKTEIENKLEIKDSPFGKTSLEQIFYSPTVKSCLYVEYSSDKGLYNRRLLDIMNDGYNSRPLEMCTSIYPTQEIMDAYKKIDGDLNNYFEDLKACDNFNERIDKYK